MVMHDCIIKNAWRCATRSASNVNVCYSYDDGDYKVDIKLVGDFAEAVVAVPSTAIGEGAMNGVEAKLKLVEYMDWYDGDYAIMSVDTFMDAVHFRVIMH